MSVVHRELLDGTWRVDGVRHYIYRMLEHTRDEMCVWFSSACGQHETMRGHYDFAGRWRKTDGLVLKEPRLLKGCVTCLECLINPISEK